MRRSSLSRSRTTKQRDLKLSRQFYAEELRAVADLQSEALVRAFAKVPREKFLGPGPWQVFSPGSESDWTTIGCGTGYYTAIMAEVVGSKGHVTAIEIDSGLAGRAHSNLSYLPHVDVFEGDGGEKDTGSCDAVLVNAGATHPRSIWLDSLRPHGRLLMSLTVTENTDRGGEGRVLKVTRQPEGFTASFISGVRIFPCVGGQDAELNQRLKEAFERGDAKSVQSLRRDKHESSDACWFHGETFCLSKSSIAT